MQRRRNDSGNRILNEQCRSNIGRASHIYDPRANDNYHHAQGLQEEVG
ncbi:MAG TPA: hypothetical protein VM677_10825 [Actinokineospora sp.]|jgi:hypothetical protein|nr:hypothetical protein [Actinokineospora sp.]